MDNEKYVTDDMRQEEDRALSGKLIRNARLRAAKEKGTHTPEQWEALKEKIGCCVFCGTTEYWLTKDHIIPVYQGGCDCIENIQPACMPCNGRKGPDETDRRGGA
jgi:5-methylcytosine-specific restriction endonuclease McrA